VPEDAYIMLRNLELYIVYILPSLYTIGDNNVKLRNYGGIILCIYGVAWAPVSVKKYCQKNSAIHNILLIAFCTYS